MGKNVLNEVVAVIAAMKCSHPVRVGIDGSSASGKTHFADKLVAPLEAMGRHVIRASIDGFHHSPENRYRRGENSVEGYVEDSFDKQAAIDQVLAPLGPSGNLEYKSSLYDFVSESETKASFARAYPDSILIFDGVMLFCDQLGEMFDYRIFVEVDEATILKRALVRDLDRLGGVDRLEGKYLNRYLPGQKLYRDRHQPIKRSHLIINNNDYEAPVVIQRNNPIQQP